MTISACRILTDGDCKLIMNLNPPLWLRLTTAAEKASPGTCALTYVTWHSIALLPRKSHISGPLCKAICSYDDANEAPGGGLLRCHLGKR